MLLCSCRTRYCQILDIGAAVSNNAFLLRFQKISHHFERIQEEDFPPPFARQGSPAISNIDLGWILWNFVVDVQDEMLRAFSSTALSQGDFNLRQRSIRASSVEWDYLLRRLSAFGMESFEKLSRRHVSLLLARLDYTTAPDPRSLTFLRIDTVSKLNLLRFVFGTIFCIGLRKKRPKVSAARSDPLVFSNTVNILALPHEVADSTIGLMRRGNCDQGVDFIYDGRYIKILIRYGRLVLSPETVAMVSSMGVGTLALSWEPAVSSFQLKPEMRFDWRQFGWTIVSVGDDCVVVRKRVDKSAIPNLRVTAVQDEVFPSQVRFRSELKEMLLAQLNLS